MIIVLLIAYGNTKFFVMWITFTIIALVSVLTSIVEAQDFESPCPRLFVYEKKSAEPNKWYGIITVLTETDLSGLWLRIIFDEPPLQIGVSTTTSF